MRHLTTLLLCLLPALALGQSAVTVRGPAGAMPAAQLTLPGTPILQVDGSSLFSIEDGLDFEKTISDILNRCKTAGDIEVAFNQLERQFEGEISKEMASAKAKVFDNLDPNVQDRLKSYDAQSGEVLNRFEQFLLAVTKYQLDTVATFEGDGRQFELHTAPVADAKTGRYFFKSQPQEHAH